MGFDHGSETFARLPLQNITESVGVAGNVTNGSQLSVDESDAESLQECILGIKRTQRHSKSVIVEKSVNDREATCLQSISTVDKTVF